ncbi:hypothetical protein BDW42DRAFT_189266 [Aspergillus taichungensis]|uniref:Uncharacterized protein n=1 Tax=Aspergillus taichungensis TaxID=482145 RepID=A0A2J5HEY8_9EURO|nr:hypothetical protein BDW42DRAFT_189266 [Aspergillus taichungensis]
MELCSFMLLALTTAILTILQPVALNTLCPSCSFVEQVELITGTLAVTLDERPTLPSSWNLSPVFGATLAPVVPVLEETMSNPAYGLPPLLDVNGQQNSPWLDQAGLLFQPVVDAIVPALSSLYHHHYLLQFGLLWTASFLGSFMAALLVLTSLRDNRGQDHHIEEIQTKSVQAIGNTTRAMAEFESKVSIMLKQIEKEQKRLCTKMRATMLSDMDACFAALNTRIQAEFEQRNFQTVALANRCWV